MKDNFENLVTEFAREIQECRTELPFVPDKIEDFLGNVRRERSAQERHACERPQVSYPLWRLLKLSQFASEVVWLDAQERFSKVVGLSRELVAAASVEIGKHSEETESVVVPKDNVDRLFENFFADLIKGRLKGEPSPLDILKRFNVKAEDFEELSVGPQSESRQERGEYRGLLFEALYIYFLVEGPKDVPKDWYSNIEAMQHWTAQRIKNRSDGSVVDSCYLLAALCGSSSKKGQVLRQHGLFKDDVIAAIREQKALQS